MARARYVLALAACLLVSGCRDDPTRPPVVVEPTARTCPAHAASPKRDPVPPQAVVVAPTGDDGASGSWERPVRTLRRGLDMATDGRTVIVRGGTYHEFLQVERPVRLQAAPGEAVWLDGAEPVAGFVADGPRWRRDGFRLTYPSGGRPDVVDPARPVSTRPEMVFVDGRPLRQVEVADQVVPGTFAVDRTSDRLFVGDAPDGRLVEASTLAEAVTISPRAGGSELIGLGVRRYATHFDRLGAVKVLGPGSLVEDLTASDNALAGLSVLATGVRVRGLNAERNGQLGLQANHADGLVVEQARLVGNNTEGFRADQAAGGAKITASRGIRFDAGCVEANDGPGLWLDESVYGATVTRSSFLSNRRSGVQFEISAHGLLASNTAEGNGEAGIYVLESSDVEIWNHTLVRNERAAIQILEGTRESTDPADRVGRDERREPDPDLTWDVKDIVVRNNLLVGAPVGRFPLIAADDSRKMTPAGAMAIALDGNGYRLESTATKDLVTWAAWPGEPRRAASIEEVRLVTGGEGSGAVLVDDWEARPRPAGAPLAPMVAEALGLPPGWVGGIGTI